MCNYLNTNATVRRNINLCPFVCVETIIKYAQAVSLSLPIPTRALIMKIFMYVLCSQTVTLQTTSTDSSLNVLIAQEELMDILSHSFCQQIVLL